MKSFFKGKSFYYTQLDFIAEGHEIEDMESDIAGKHQQALSAHALTFSFLMCLIFEKLKT